MTIKRKIRLLLHKRNPQQEENISVRIRVKLPKQSPIDLPTGVQVNASDWDSKHERLLSSAPNASEINLLLADYIDKMNDVFVRYEVFEKRIPTADDIRILFNDLTGRKPLFEFAEEQNPTIKDAYDEFIETTTITNNWSQSTVKKHRTVQKHFVKANGSKLKVQDLTIDHLRKFVDMLYTSDYRHSTIEKDFSILKIFLNWAKTKEYYNGKCDSYRPRIKGKTNIKEIIYLTIDELNQLRNLNIPSNKNYLNHVRDVFLFCCFTSLRYSDAYNLKKTNIVGDKMYVVTQKTTDALIIDLNKNALAILDKYKDEKMPSGKALPVISNQKMNDYLKELGEMAGLNNPTRIVYFKGGKRYDEVYPKWQLLTSHCARRTFVVTALQLGISPEVIMRWTGHSSFEAMKPYVAIVDELKRREMNKFDLL